MTDNHPVSKFLPLSSRLLELRDIVGFSADYILHALESLEDEQQQHIVFCLCTNLQRARACLEQEILSQGEDVSHYPYNPNYFTNVDFLKIDINQVVKQFKQTYGDEKIRRLANKLGH